MKDIVRQTSLITASNVATRVVAVLFSIVLARALTVSDYGLFKYLMTLSTVYAIAFTGIPTAMTKFIGENKTDRQMISGHFTNALAASFAIFLILSLVISVANEDALSLILLLFAMLVDLVYVGFIRGLLDYVKLAGFKLVENVLQLVVLLIVYFAFHRLSLRLAIVFYSLSGLASLLIFESFRREISLRLSLSISRVMELIRYAIPVLLGAIGWVIMLGTNTIVIKQYYGTDQVGFYSVGVTLSQVFSFLPESIATILMPKAAGIREKARVAKYVWRAIWISAALSAIGLVPLLYFKSEIVTVIFTDKYLAAAAIILPLSLAQIFISTHQIIAAAWQGLGRPGVPSITISIAAALNIAGSLILTARYGIIGAGVSIAISSFVATIAIAVWLWLWSGPRTEQVTVVGEATGLKPEKV